MNQHIVNANTDVDVSVVIPCRNAAAYISSLLSSLAAQDYQGAWEVILVDNGSTDETLDIARASHEDLPLRICDAGSRPNSAAARVLGAQASRGSKLLFIDADDEVNPSYVRALAQALQNHECVAASFDIDTLNPEWSRAAHGPNWQKGGLWTAYGFLPTAGPAIGIHANLYKEVGGHHQQYQVIYDTALSWCVQLAGRDIHFVPSAVYRYRFRESVRGLYTQTRLWGEENVLLYKDFRHAGMPRRTWSHTSRDWVTLARLLPGIRRKSARAHFAAQLGATVGRLRGTLRYRTWYL